jgi:hypothetical protein
MEKSVDLDVNNYNITDLVNFFKLNNEYSLLELDEREKEFVMDILSNNNSYNSTYKFDIINFVKLAKDVLKSYYNDIETSKEVNKNISKLLKNNTPTNIGRIINPLSPHQSLQSTIIPPNEINGYNYKTTTSIYVFNTTARHDYFTSISTDSTFILPIKWKDVISISLVAANIPNVMFAFSNDMGTNQIFIREDVTGIEGIVILPEGNYVGYDGSLSSYIGGVSFADTLEYEINTQLSTASRFKVNISQTTGFTTITNTTNTFSINTIKKTENFRCNPYVNEIINDHVLLVKNEKSVKNTKNCNEYILKDINVVDKSQIKPSIYFQTLGYLMGFRDINYSGNNSYTSESIFNNIYSSYLYLILEDYTGAQQSSNTFGILKNGILDRNILGVIPITSSISKITFDSNANFIYKKREYFGPVDISKISVKLINQLGEIVNLHETDYNFSIQVTTIYDLNSKGLFEYRNSDFFN